MYCPCNACIIATLAYTITVIVRQVVDLLFTKDSKCWPNSWQSSDKDVFRSCNNNS